MFIELPRKYDKKNLQDRLITPTQVTILLLPIIFLRTKTDDHSILLNSLLLPYFR